LDHVPFMDITGIQTLEEVIGKLRKRGVLVLVCEANPRVHGKLQNAGVLGGGADGDSIYCSSLREALLRAGVGVSTALLAARE
jgi:SulP family sulfate permease